VGKNSKKRRAAKGTAGRQQSGSVSLNSFRAGRALDSLAPAFVQWFDDGMPGAAAAAMEYLKLIEPVLSRYIGSTATADVTNLDPTALADAVAQTVTDPEAGRNAEVPESELAAYIVDAIRSYIEFLAETGRWTGSEGQLARIVDFFASFSDEDRQPNIQVPDISDDDALAAFSSMPLIQRATALLQWIGEGKPVTGTGALRLRDIEAAAACVGVAAKGGARQEDAGDDVLTVRSMYEVPLLADMWAAFQDAEMLQVKPTKVVPFEGAGPFLASDPAQQVDEFRVFTEAFLRQAVLRFDRGQPWESTLAALLVSVLLAAATPEPPLVERVLAVPDHAHESEQEAAVLLTEVAMARLRELADLGLLTIDTHFRVPPVLIEGVAETFDDPGLMAKLGLDESFDDEEEAAPVG
jgi:hypothetical protein